MGLIQPTRKGDSKSVCWNYQSVSILPLPYLVKCIKNLYTTNSGFLEINDILCKNQFGFQWGKSTENAVLDLYKSILQAIESKEKTSCIFLDFANKHLTL